MFLALGLISMKTFSNAQVDTPFRPLAWNTINNDTQQENNRIL